MLNFLGLADTYSEQDLESAILREIEQFLLELGSDFTFVARQKRLTIDKEDFYLDLMEQGEIRVAEYLTELPPQPVLEAKLHEAVRIARE